MLGFVGVCLAIAPNCGDMRSTMTQENGTYACSPTRTPGIKWKYSGSSPGKDAPTTASPFKRGGAVSNKSVATTSRMGRSVFTDKTNQSPSPVSKTIRTGDFTWQKSLSPSVKKDGLTVSPTKTPWDKMTSDARGARFITPADNIGRAGQIKARLGELYDAERPDVNLEKGDETQAIDAVSEEEFYPEIEELPSSNNPKSKFRLILTFFLGIPYDFPPELDGYPRAKQAASMLAKPPLLGRISGGMDASKNTWVRQSDLALKPLNASCFRTRRKQQVVSQRQPAMPRRKPRASTTDVMHDSLSTYIENAIHETSLIEGFQV